MFAPDAQLCTSALEWVSIFEIHTALGSGVSISHSVLALMAAFTIHCNLGLYWHIHAQRYLAIWSLWMLADVLCVAVELSLKALLRSRWRPSDTAGDRAALAGKAEASLAEPAPGTVGGATEFFYIGEESEEEVQTEAARDTDPSCDLSDDTELDKQRGTGQAPAAPNGAGVPILASTGRAPSMATGFCRTSIKGVLDI